MDRKSACLIQARKCIEKAQDEPARKAHWVGEAREWQRRAQEGGGNVAVTHEIVQGKLVPKPAG